MAAAVLTKGAGCGPRRLPLGRSCAVDTETEGCSCATPAVNGKPCGESGSGLVKLLSLSAATLRLLVGEAKGSLSDLLPRRMRPPLSPDSSSVLWTRGEALRLSEVKLPLRLSRCCLRSEFVCMASKSGIASRERSRDGESAEGEAPGRALDCGAFIIIVPSRAEHDASTLPLPPAAAAAAIDLLPDFGLLWIGWSLLSLNQPSTLAILALTE